MPGSPLELEFAEDSAVGEQVKYFVTVESEDELMEALNERILARTGYLADPKALVDPTVVTMGILPDAVVSRIKALGDRLVKVWIKEGHDFFCNESDDRDALLTALGIGAASAVTALAGVFLSAGLAVGLAPIVAAIIYNRIIKPGGKEFCTLWAEEVKRLEAR